MHPADEIRGSSSTKLAGKTIVLGVTGSIAAVETIALARELIRHGANIIPVMTPAATRIIHPDALEFATGHTPIVELSGKTEHVTWCGLTKNRADLLIISPCTANTLSKIVHGIDDTAVTTFATTALGSQIPIILVPAMHLSMYQHPVIQRNIMLGRKDGLVLLEPRIRKNKATMPKTETIVTQVIRTIGNQKLQRKKVLIIGGGTAEPIDDVRVITNKSSGKTAVALARTAFEQGGDVDFWYGCASEPAPEYLQTTRFETYADLTTLVQKTALESFDIIIVCAAIADYTLTKKLGKISSEQKKLILELQQTPKILHKIRKKAPHAILIGFKLEPNKKTLEKKSLQLLQDHRLDAVVGNTVETMGHTVSDIIIVTKQGKIYQKKGRKEDIVLDIFDILATLL
ncbi:MAG: bifunctional phosphopantothenoylcysteine decarboxylase/phosphopantothenate--cysteine ligase CoaBC [Candidatus Thermoplasmatota archaeon]